jgi:hypothetical protein
MEASETIKASLTYTGRGAADRFPFCWPFHHSENNIMPKVRVSTIFFFFFFSIERCELLTLISFVALQPNRTYDLEDLRGQAWQWKTAIEELQNQHPLYSSASKG